MAFRIEFTFLRPRIWLLAAAMLAVAAIGIYYYQSQTDATRTLAMRLGLPETVAIQDFKPMMHSNHMGEVQLAAQARLTDIRPVPGQFEPPLYFLPLYASDGGTAPFGFYISTRDSSAAGFEAFGLTGISEVDGMSLVTVVGTHIQGQSALGGSNFEIVESDLGLQRGAFMVAGDLIERAEMLGDRDVTAFRNTLASMALLCAAMSIVSLIHGRRRVVIGRVEPKPVPETKSARSKQAFQPLASQDEIRRSDEVERARRRRSRLSFATTFSADPANSVRNPR